MGYLKNTISGLSWMGAFRVITRIFAYLRIAILARILTPEQFGLFGIASLILSFLETLSQTGINVILIQEKQSIKEYIDTAWIVSIIRGILISLIIVMSAPLIVSFFNASDSYKLLLLIAVVAFIRGFINPSRVIYIKELKFKNEFLFSFVIFSVDSIVAVLVALIYRTPASLVWGLISGAILEVVMSHLLLKPKPRPIFNWNSFKTIIKRGKWVTGSSIFNYLFSEGDDWVVGKLLNTTDLGLYQIAYKVSTLPITEVTNVVNQVAFPVYVQIEGDKKRLKRAFKIATLGIVSIVIPIGLFLFIFPNLVVHLILGDQWLGAVPVIRVLALFGMIQAIIVSVIPLFNAVKKQEFISYYTFISLIVMGLLIVPMVMKFNVIGAAYAVMFGSLSAIPFLIIYLHKTFER